MKIFRLFGLLATCCLALATVSCSKSGNYAFSKK